VSQFTHEELKRLGRPARSKTAQIRDFTGFSGMPAVTRPQQITFGDAIHVASALVAERDDKRVRN
jgi:hypothetical protein